MAPLKVRKPAAIMFDVMATTTKSLIDQVINPYIKKNANTYLEDNWSSEVVQQDVKLLREAAKKDKSSVQIADASADVETIQRTVCDYVNKALDELKDNEALTQFRFHIIFDGYAKDRIQTPVNTDEAIQILKWAVDEKIKLYAFSNGWKEATKRYLQKTNQGDMNMLIEDHFDNSDGPLTDPATFKKVVDKVKQAPEDILFITHSGKEGYAAKQAGLSVILLMTHRRDVNKLSEQEKKDLPYCRSFNQIIFSSDAPKARELDGSSVVDDHHHKSSAGKASVTSTKSTGSAKSKKSDSSTTKSADSSSKKAGAKKSDSKSKSSSATSTKSKSASKGGGSSKTGSKTGSKAGSKVASTEGGGSKSTDGSKAGSSAAGSSAVDKSASKSSSSNSKADSNAGSSAGSKATSADGGGGSKSTDGSKAGSETSSANDSKSTAGSQADSATGGTSADGGSASSDSPSGSK